MKKISVIIPIFNEEAILLELFNRLILSTANLNYDLEFIFVDDGSQDSSFLKLVAMQERDSRFKVVKLSRNWGHQNAYNAGLDYATGDAIVFIDGDLEDPPEIIPELLKQWENGYDIVYLVKEERQDSLLKKLLISIFYRLIKTFSEVSVDSQSGMFSLVSRKAANELRKCREKNKYYVGLRSFVGFKQTKISYKRDKRFHGRPKQTYKKLINYALNALFSFSFLPIRLLTTFGFFLLAIIFLSSVLLFIIKVFDVQLWFFNELPGWTSIVMLIMLILGVQIIFLGVLGEYIARIFDEVRNRPYYIVDDIYGFRKFEAEDTQPEVVFRETK